MSLIVLSLTACDAPPSTPPHPTTGKAFMDGTKALPGARLAGMCAAANVANDNGVLRTYSDLQVSNRFCELTAVTVEQVGRSKAYSDSIDCQHALFAIGAEFRRRWPATDLQAFVKTCRE